MRISFKPAGIIGIFLIGLGCVGGWLAINQNIEDFVGIPAITKRFRISEERIHDFVKQVEEYSDEQGLQYDLSEYSPNANAISLMLKNYGCLISIRNPFEKTAMRLGVYLKDSNLDYLSECEGMLSGLLNHLEERGVEIQSDEMPQIPQVPK
jgi:hypothetical protein